MTAEFDAPFQSEDSGTFQASLHLLETEYISRMRQAADDVTVAAWRLEEAAELLLREAVSREKQHRRADRETVFTDDTHTALLSPDLLSLYRRFTEDLAKTVYHTENGSFTQDDAAFREGKRYLCHRLYSLLTSKAAYAPLRLQFPPKEETGEETVCYVRSRFADEVYDGLFPYLNRPKALYAENFDLASEALADDRCTALILPYETEDGGMLRGVETLLDGYDFKKEWVVEISTSTGKTSYALLRRHLTFLPDADTAEFRLPYGSGTLLSDLPSFAAEVGASTLCAELLRRKYGGFYRFLFRGSTDALLQIFFYLSLEYPGFTAGGFYKTLSAVKETEGQKQKGFFHSV